MKLLKSTFVKGEFHLMLDVRCLISRKNDNYSI